MSGRFDPFDQRELALLSMGVATAVAFIATGSDDDDPEDRKKGAQTCLDAANLMDEIATAETWGETHPPGIDPDLRAALEAIVREKGG